VHDKVLVSTGNDENKFIAAIEEYYFGTKVYLDKEQNLVKRVSDDKVLNSYRLNKGRLQMCRHYQ